MKKLLLFTLCNLFLSTINVYSATYSWDYYQRTDWNDQEMPDGDIYSADSEVWYYKYTPVGSDFDNGNYTLLPYWVVHTGWTGWRVSTNSSNPDYWCVTSFDKIHPSVNNDVALVFKSQMAGEYNIYIDTLNLSGGNSNGQIIYIQHNSSVLYTRSNSDSQSQIFDFTQYLDVGDEIILRLNANGNQNCDTTLINSFKLTTTAVPEPASILLLLSGISVLLSKDYRR